MATTAELLQERLAGLGASLPETGGMDTAALLARRLGTGLDRQSGAPGGTAALLEARMAGLGRQEEAPGGLVSRALGVGGTVLDYLNRPYSAVMGAVSEVGGMRPHEGFMKGLRGERNYGVADVLEQAGAPEGNVTNMIGLVGDILNPLDPMAYVTFGFSKAGKAAKGMQKAGGALADAGKASSVATRALAVEADLWKGLQVGGIGVTPKALNRVMAKGLDTAAETVSRSKAYRALGRHFGGVQKLSAQWPGLSDVLRGKKSGSAMAQEDFVKEIGAMAADMEKFGKSPAQIDAAFRELSDLLESPKQKLARLQGELVTVESGLATGARVEAATGVLGGLDPAVVERAKGLSQAEVVERVKALEGARAVEGLPAAAADELHVLQSLDVSRLGKDMPPREDLWRRRGELLGEIGRVTSSWDKADAVVRSVVPKGVKLLEDTQEVYTSRAGRFGDVEFPIEYYVKHAMPAAMDRLGKRLKTDAGALSARRAALVKQYAAKGYDDAAVTAAVERDLRREGLTAGAFADGGMHQFSQRAHDMTIRESIEKYQKGELEFHFDDHAGLLLAAGYRDAQRWGYQFDAHDFIREQGWMKGEAEVAALPLSERKNWVPVDFRVPFLKDPGKDPFRGQMMPKDVAQILGAHGAAVNEFTRHDGLNGLLEAGHMLRRWWSAWTLAPFPSYQVRNLGSDGINAHLGGLSPVKDLARAVQGTSAYAGATGVLSRFMGMGGDFSAETGMGIRNFEGILGEVNGALKSSLGPDDVVKYLREQGILGGGAVRDLDAPGVSDAVLAKSVRAERSATARFVDWLPLVDPERSRWVRGGYKVSEVREGFTRSALWLHALREIAPESASVEDAMKYATYTVRKHLFDYSDLTDTERKYVKLLSPFYCVPTDHEILTREGFKHVDQLRIGEDVLALDHEKGTYHWTPLLEVARFDYDSEEHGPLLSIQRRFGSFDFTPNHRWPVETKRTFVKGKWYGGERKIVEGKDLNSNYLIPLLADFHEEHSALSERHAAILGWVITDGYWRWRGNHCEMVVYQTEKKFADKVTELLGVPPRPAAHPVSKQRTWTVPREDVEAITCVFRREEDLSRIACCLSRAAAEAMYCAMMMADGSKGGKYAQRFLAAREGHRHKDAVRDLFQILCVLTGRRATCNPRGLYVQNGKYLDMAGGLVEKAYRGEVWCPRTAFGTWVMRHDGAVIPSGNTFTAKNLPLQIEKALTDPGRSAWVGRAYNSAWGQHDPGAIAPEDLPDWMEKELGLPLLKAKNDEGVDVYQIFTPRGWLPQSELMELANVMRLGESRSELMSRLNPLLKEAVEQVYDKDAFTGRQITEQQGEIFGFAAPPRVLHLVRNLRLVTELDRLNPGGIFTAIGEKSGAHTGEKRPHRQEADESARWVQALGGVALKGVEPVESQMKAVRNSRFEMQSAEGKARLAMREGNLAEVKMWEGRIGAAREDAKAGLSALERLRAYRAADFAGRMQRGGVGVGGS